MRQAKSRATRASAGKLTTTLKVEENNERHLGAQLALDGAAEFRWVHPDLIKVWVRNPRKNQAAVSKVAASIQRFGFVRPIVVNTWQGCLHEIIVGHTARLAALELGLELVPVRFVNMPPDEAHAAALADNKLGEISAWDDTELRKLLGEGIVPAALFSVAGFKQSDIDRLGRPLVADDDGEQARTKKPVTRPGDLWVLGRHRLVCGDSTVAAVAALALDGAKPKLMVTDPPYGANFDPSWRRGVAERSGICKPPKRTGAVANDDRASWVEAWKLSPANVAYVWHSALMCDIVKVDLVAAGFELRQQIIWAKPQINFTRCAYHWQHEPAFYCVRQGKGASWIGDRKQSTLWQIESKHGVSNPDDDDSLHSTQKPVECMARPIRHHEGDVYDPFVGSGTTLVAAEELGRTCYAVELDPGWCDTAVARWERRTGGKAVRHPGALRKAPALALIEGGKTGKADRSRARTRKG